MNKKEKQYLISKGELIKFVQSHYLTSDKKMGKEIALDFLKSKSPALQLNREEVEEIITDFKDFMLTWTGFFQGQKDNKATAIFWEEYHKAITAICNLVPEGDK